MMAFDEESRFTIERSTVLSASIACAASCGLWDCCGISIMGVIFKSITGAPSSMGDLSASAVVGGVVVVVVVIVVVVVVVEVLVVLIFAGPDACGVTFISSFSSTTLSSS
jgi:hypothetical protein